MNGEQDRRSPAWTPEQRDQLRAIARRTLADKPTEAEMDASGAYSGPLPLGVVQDMLLAMIALREAREALNLSLTDVSERSGITRAAICKLENGHGNPTMQTIGRYAASLGKRVRLVLEDLIPDEPAGPGSPAMSST